MIECPICHVMNEDQAHFCSECGQRFNVQAQAPQPSYPTTPEPSFPNFPAADNSGYAYSQPPGQPQQPAPFQVQTQQPAPFQVQPQQPAPFPGQPQPQTAPVETPFPTTVSFPEPSTSFQSPPAFQTPQAFPAPGNAYPNNQSNSSYSEPDGFSASPLTPPEPLAPPPSLAASLPPPIAESPLPPRPRLHSPILGSSSDDQEDGSMPGRPSNPNMIGHGTMEVRRSRGLRSPMLGGGSAGQDDDDPPPSPQKGKSGLRSPLLRGDDDDNQQQLPGNNKQGLRPLRRSDDLDPPASGKKGGLRSPLLGGGGDDDSDYPPAPKQKGGLRSPLLNNDYDEQNSSGRFNRPQGQSKGGSHLRSPLLGGVDDYEGDEEDDLRPAPSSGKSTFPHVRRPNKDQDREPVDQSQSGRLPGKGLRSPLLGGADDYDEEQPAPRSQGGRSQAPAGKQRLHSPVLGGGGSGQNYEDDEEPYYEEINDPNVLRSPLLAARTHQQPQPAKQPPPPQPQQYQQTQAPQPQYQQTQPPQAQYQQPVQQQGQPDLAAPPGQGWPNPGYPPAPNPAALAPQPAPAPTEPQQPLRDRGFPEPEPRPDMWRDRGFSQTQPPQRQAQPEPQSEHQAPTAVQPPNEVASAPLAPAPLRRRSSALLPPSGDDDYETPISRHSSSAPAGPPKPVMFLMVPAVAAGCVKGYYLFTLGAQLLAPAMHGFLFDNVMQMVVMFALAAYAFTAGKK